MEFTKDELYEIEKLFDINAIPTAERIYKLCIQLREIGDNNTSEIISKEAVTMFTRYREISAKCKQIRLKK